jgi:hypothetical protein
VEHIVGIVHLYKNKYTSAQKDAPTSTHLPVMALLFAR